MSSKRDFDPSAERIFRRSDAFHQMLMEEVRFMEAARLHSGQYNANTLTTRDLFPKEHYKMLVDHSGHYLVNLAQYASKPKIDAATQKMYDSDMRSLRFQTRMAKWPPLGIWAHWLLNTKFFQTLMIIVILLNTILIVIDQELEVILDRAEDKVLIVRVFMEIIDFFFLCLFVAEIALKWLDDFGKFWFDGWNRFDLVCTCFSLIPPFVDLFISGEPDELESKGVFIAVRFFRTLRILRLLNVVTRIQKIQVIWQAVMKTFKELFSIVMLMAIFFYIFSIVGINIFEKFTKSHRPHLLYRGAFDNMLNAGIHLFLVFTVDNYQDLLDSLMIIPDLQFRALFFILLWILIAGFIFQNIFTGVMVNNFQSIRQNLVDEHLSVQKSRRAAMEMALNDDDDVTEEGNDNPTVHLGWEKDVLQNLIILESMPDCLTPSIWPRDTLFLYHVLLSSLASNTDERNFILKKLDEALVRTMDP